MQLRYALAVIVALLSQLPPSALAQSERRAGEWTIHDTADGPGCQVRLTNASSVTTIEDMAYILMAYQPETSAVVFIAGRRTWNLAPGQAYPLSLRFDDRRPIGFELQAERIGKEVALFGKSALLESLLEPMSSARNLSLDPGNGRAADLKLDGGGEAMAALRACLRQAGSQPPPTAAPAPTGSPPRTRKADPFAD